MFASIASKFFVTKWYDTIEIDDYTYTGMLQILEQI